LINAALPVNTNYRVIGGEAGYRVQLFCSLCDFVYTSDRIKAASEEEAYRLAEPEAKLKFNGCHKCGSWICDEHYNADAQMCTGCAPSAKPRRGRLLLAAVLCVALVVTGVVVFYNRFGYSSLADEQTALAAPALPDDSVDSDGSAENCVTFPQIESLTIPADTKDVKVYLLNPKANSCSLVFEIVLNEEMLYKSGPVGPGIILEEVTLTKELAKGEYKSLLRISAYDPASPEVIYAAGAELLIIVI